MLTVLFAFNLLIKMLLSLLCLNFNHIFILKFLLHYVNTSSYINKKLSQFLSITSWFKLLVIMEKITKKFSYDKRKY